MGKPRTLKVYLLNWNRWLLFVLLFLLTPFPLALVVLTLDKGHFIPEQLVIVVMALLCTSAMYVPALLAGRYETFEFTDEGMKGPKLSVEWRAVVSFRFGVWGRANKFVFTMNDGTKVKFYGAETMGKRNESFRAFQNMVVAYLRRYNERNGLKGNDHGTLLFTRKGALNATLIFTSIGILFLVISADGEDMLNGALFMFVLAAIFLTMFLYAKKKTK